MPRKTRAQTRHNVVPEIPTSLPSDLPVPSTSRNLLPRSRTTSVARSASRSHPGSRGSSRRSSLSGSKSGDSARQLESSLSESRPSTPSGTISERGPTTEVAYSRGRNQVLGPSSADSPAEGTSNAPQSQEPSSNFAVQQRRSSPRMFPFYDFNGTNSEQDEQSGNIGNSFQEQTDNTWYLNGPVDEVPQQPGFFPFDSEDAFAMRQNLSLGANENSNMMHNSFDSSTGPVPGSSTGHRSSSNMSYFQGSGGTNLDQNGRNGFWYRENTTRQSHSSSGPSFGYSSMSGLQNLDDSQRGYYTGDVVPPSPPEERGFHYYPNHNLNHSVNSGWPPSRPVYLAHTFDPWNTRASMDYLGSTDPSLSMNSGSATGTSTQPPTSFAESTGFYQQTPPESSGNPDHIDPLAGVYTPNTMNISSLNQWQTVAGPSAQGPTSSSMSAKRKRSPEDESLSHPSSSRFTSSFRPAGEPSSQGSGHVDSDNEVAEQLLYFNGNGSSQPQPDSISDGPSSQQNNSVDRKGKGKARAQTPVNEQSIIDITDSPPSDRNKPPVAATADAKKVLDTDKTGSRQKPPGDPLSSYTCPICFSPPTNATITPCGHICCGACLFAAVKTTLQRSSFGVGPRAPLSEARCPVCRATIPGWDGKGGGVIGLKVRAIFSL